MGKIHKKIKEARRVHVNYYAKQSHAAEEQARLQRESDPEYIRQEEVKRIAREEKERQRIMIWGSSSPIKTSSRSSLWGYAPQFLTDVLNIYERPKSRLEDYSEF